MNPTLPIQLWVFFEDFPSSPKKKKKKRSRQYYTDNNSLNRRTVTISRKIDSTMSPKRRQQLKTFPKTQQAISNI